MVATKRLQLHTRGHSDIIDITQQLMAEVALSGLECVIVNLFVVRSIAGLTTMECEPGLVEDTRAFWQRPAPEDVG